MHATISKMGRKNPFDLNLICITCNNLKESFITSFPTLIGLIPRRIAEESSRKGTNRRIPNLCSKLAPIVEMSEEEDE